MEGYERSLFFNSIYNFNSTRKDYNKKDYISLTLGYGRYLNNKFLLNSSINFESKMSSQLNHNLWINLAGTYYINSDYYINANYSRYLKGNGYKNSISISFGARF